MCTRQSFLALCRDRDLHVATLFPGKLSGLGHDIGLICRNINLLASCRDTNFVSRQGLGLGVGSCVAIRVPLCRDRVFLRLGHSCHDIRFYVMTGFPRVVLRQRASCRDPQTRPTLATEHWACA